MRVAGVILLAVLTPGCRQLFGIDDTAVATDAPANRTDGPPDGVPVPDAVPAPDAALVVVVFRNGVANYAGTEDTNINEQTPNENNAGGADVDWQINGDGTQEYALLQFADIVGSNSGQIPPGAEVVQATVLLVLTQQTLPPAGTVSEIAVPWDENDTWNTFGPTPGVQASDLGVAVAPAPVSGTANIDVTASVQRWSAAPLSNHGWIVSPAVVDPAAFSSSENNGQNRPTLTVTYELP